MDDQQIFNKFFENQAYRGNYTTYDHMNYFICYFGIDQNESYNHNIYKIHYNIKNRGDIILIDKHISNPSDFDMINRLKNILKSYKNKLENLNINIVDNESLNYKFKINIDIILEENRSEFANERVKENFIIKIISWLKEYISNININKDIPKIIFYGDIKKHELFFLKILYLSGFDVLYLNPNSKVDISLLKMNQDKNFEIVECEFSKENISFEQRKELGYKIERTSVKKAFTVGAQASKRISEELLHDSGFIKPWQLQDKTIKNLLLSTTVDEIDIYWNEPTKLRPGFEFDDNFVQLPVFFSKINGVNNYKNDYIDFLESLRRGEHTYFVEYKGQESMFFKEFKKTDFSLSFFISSKGKIDRKEILNNPDYTISTLNIKQQNMILDKVEELFQGNLFYNGISGEERIKSLNSVLKMNVQFTRMINNFDYSSVNPKLVLFLSKGYIFSKQFCFFVLLLSKIGFDIVVLSPGGENSIENIIVSKLIDSHRLDKMEYNLEFASMERETNLFQKLFGKRR
ncbi:MAG: YceG family protein [Clostridioides sp.]|jgi:hypothetical protein|nr:YceG family protein [Clostridioides sp.]